MRTLLLVLTLVVPLAARAADPPAVQLVETVPVETELADLGLPGPQEVWLDMIDGARSTIRWAAFYVSPNPDAPDRLDPVLEALERAAGRGVAVKILADAGFHDTYPATLDHLGTIPGIEMRLLDYSAVAGGVMHAKYFLVDGREAYVGSQNTDWRSLEHIWEMGARVRLRPYVEDLTRVFLRDWDRAASEGDLPAGGGLRDDGPAHRVIPFVDAAGDSATLWSAFSPEIDLPADGLWDLPKILDRIRAAADTVRLTALSYKPKSRDGSYWPDFEVVLRQAAVRGVTVQLLVSHWNTSESGIDWLKSLHAVPGIEVRVATIPEASTGFVPFSRVTHAKFLVVDGRSAWLGTSNLEKSYFYSTRNVGFVVESAELAGTLDAAFRRMWDGPYAEPIDLGRDYPAPRVAQ